MAESDRQAIATSVELKLRIPGKPTDDRTSEITRAPVSLDHERRGQSSIPRPLGTLLASSSGPAPPSLAHRKRSAALRNRHDVNTGDVEPKPPPT